MIYFIARYLIPKKIKLEVVAQFLFALEMHAPKNKGEDATLREIREHLERTKVDGTQ